ncbi:hypothetical protein MB901379_02615 [Mycobacterium basiliense]|uniref:Uncharacterized protein n=2 Tax=Mycobacterium basiliense TaxID=2094119 RepID=A0A447GF12_9MYCO|nr:hypothetical protein MB901379_02615 [Mycobacterium basiliense]
MKHPIDLGWQSEEFHWSILNRFYSGWYPTGDDYVLAAQESNFGLIREWDMTSHYARTSVDWAQQLSAAWREHRKEMSAIYMNLLNRDPRYFVITMFYTFYGTWMWQMLGGGESGAIHKWQLYNLTSP